MANTNIECTANGRTVTTTNIPGCREAIINIVFGLLSMSKDVAGLYVAMKTIMNMNNEQKKYGSSWQKTYGKFVRQIR